MREVHPLLEKTLGNEVPIAIVGRGKALKFFWDQLRRLDSCEGWQLITITTYDKTTGTPTMRMVERHVTFGFPQKHGTKVPNFFLTDQGGYKTALPLPDIGWFLRALNIVPSDKRAPEESAWVVVVTCSPILPVQVFRNLTESTCVVVGYTGKSAEKADFIRTLATTIANMECLYIVDWEEWFVNTDEGPLCAVVKACSGNDADSDPNDVQDVDAPD